MASEVTIQYAERIADLTLHGLVIKGNVVAHDGTGWVQADASDAATNLYAQYIAMQSGKSGNVIKGCKSCVLYDADAPYTANATAYVSATPGAITHTRPATNGDVIQVIGRGISTTELKVDIENPREVEEVLFSVCNGQGTAGIYEIPIADTVTKEWAGANADAAANAAVFVGRMPSGMVGAPLAADLSVNTQLATALAINVAYVAAYNEASNVGDAGVPQTGLTSATATADNTIHRVDIKAGMDADFAKAGINFGVSINPTAGSFIPLCLTMRYLVV